MYFIYVISPTTASELRPVLLINLFLRLQHLVYVLLVLVRSMQSIDLCAACRLIKILCLPTRSIG